MKLRGVDTETHLIQPGVLAPPLVCLSHAHYVGDAIESDLVLRDDGLSWIEEQLLNPDVILAIHNGSFDMGVVCAMRPSLVPLVFDAYRAHRIRCTIVRQKLIDIALGMRKFRRLGNASTGQKVVVKSTYALADLVKLYLDEDLEKKDTWRMSYALLDNVPIKRWPPGAAEYARRDAVEHLRVYGGQEKWITETWGELPNQAEQQQAAWALHLMSMWGVRAEQTAVDRFIDHCDEEIAKMRRDLYDTGIFKGKFKCGGHSKVKCAYTADTEWKVSPATSHEVAESLRVGSGAGKSEACKVQRSR